MAHTKQTPEILMWIDQQLPWVVIFSLKEESLQNQLLRNYP